MFNWENFTLQFTFAFFWFFEYFWNCFEHFCCGCWKSCNFVFGSSRQKHVNRTFTFFALLLRLVYCLECFNFCEYVCMTYFDGVLVGTSGLCKSVAVGLLAVLNVFWRIGLWVGWFFVSLVVCWFVLQFCCLAWFGGWLWLV
jgi:hypothetical protein